jgi:phosphoribosylformylglycinamidine cyclo-ligase
VATGKVEPGVVEQVIGSVARGCRENGCALLGGETAEMPGMYPQGEYDLAGFCVGVVEKKRIIDGGSIKPGDAVLGLASSGAHSNGYSLIRRILETANPDLRSDFHGKRFGDVLLEPTRIYVKPVLALMKKLRVKGLAHVTGGGLVENLPRVLPAKVKAAISRSSWEVPPLFRWLQREGRVADDEMLRVFNCGIGMTVIVAEESADAARRALTAAGETVFRIGRIEPRKAGEPQCRVS